MAFNRVCESAACSNEGILPRFNNKALRAMISALWFSSNALLRVKLDSGGVSKWQGNTGIELVSHRKMWAQIGQRHQKGRKAKTYRRS